MSLSKQERLSLYETIKKELCGFTNKDIENGVMYYCLERFKRDNTKYFDLFSKNVADILGKYEFSVDFENIVEFFESLIEEKNKNENGIVFTPKYIAQYIVEKSVLIDEKVNNIKLIDPGCGCDIFLVTAAEYLINSNSDIDNIIHNNIYGIEIDSDNARRCSLVIRLLSAKYGGDFENVRPNIVCKDSLRCNWAKVFNVRKFDYIIGNPPYVNPHDMNKETINFLKGTFKTTKSGVFNIFYAFIEYAMTFLSATGTLGYIVPNNFLTIKSAINLRLFIKENKLLKTIVDFGENMVFKSVRTYNCILFLDRQDNKDFTYGIVSKSDNLILQNIQKHINVCPYKGKNWIHEIRVEGLLRGGMLTEELKGLISMTRSYYFQLLQVVLNLLL